MFNKLNILYLIIISNVHIILYKLLILLTLNHLILLKKMGEGEIRTLKILKLLFSLVTLKKY